MADRALALGEAVALSVYSITIPATSLGPPLMVGRSVRLIVSVNTTTATVRPRQSNPEGKACRLRHSSAVASAWPGKLGEPETPPRA